MVWVPGCCDEDGAYVGGDLGSVWGVEFVLCGLRSVNVGLLWFRFWVSWGGGSGAGPCPEFVLGVLESSYALVYFVVD